MAAVIDESDPQGHAEIYDETHLDDEGDGDLMPDELDDVLDVTRVDDDPDEYPEDAPDTSSPDDPEMFDLNAVDDDAPSSANEIELVYTGLMRNVRGAQASAAHWEARRLDDDIADLGYAPDAPETEETP